MKKLFGILFAMAILLACSTKKTETVSTSVDTTAVDSVIATTPAQSALAFSSLNGFSVKAGTPLPDSTNYFLLGSQEQLNQYFSSGSDSPDFIINYIVAAVLAPTQRTTSISIDKAVTGDSSLDIYLTVTRGADDGKKVSPVQMFAIERREGYPVMQFYVNGKKDKALVLVGNP